MRLRLVLATATAAVVLMLPGAAGAKGAESATIEGEDLAAPITLTGGEHGAEGEGDLGLLAGDSGFYPSVFETESDPTLQAAPTTDLGPRLVVTWQLLGPSDELIQIRQELYPFAEGGPLSYVPPGQPLFESGATRGGWFRAPRSLLNTLERVGAVDGTDRPAPPPAPAPTEAPAPAASREPSPAPADGREVPAWTLGLAAALVTAGLAGLAGLSARRRRTGVAPA